MNGASTVLIGIYAQLIIAQPESDRRSYVSRKNVCSLPGRLGKCV